MSKHDHLDPTSKLEELTDEFLLLVATDDNMPSYARDCATRLTVMRELRRHEAMHGSTRSDHPTMRVTL
jgi:hypothetical protein